MPRYFFHVRNHVHTKDTVGTEVADLSAARREALSDIADIRRTQFSMLDGHWAGWSIEVCDEDGELLLTVPFISN
jgi:hypothetical protein